MRTSHHTRNATTGEWEVVEAARVKLGAVQGEPFGSATPSGSLDMVIVNPAALKIFREAKLGQEFDVLFSPVEAK
ncbi:MAG: hypothetical protein ACRDHW_02510 [Ktedonobacteraceae bacterium]